MQECIRKHTHRQYLVALEALKKRKREHGVTDLYLVRVVYELKVLIYMTLKIPVDFTIESVMFDFDKLSKEVPEPSFEEKVERSKAHWRTVINSAK